MPLVPTLEITTLSPPTQLLRSENNLGEDFGEEFFGVQFGGDDIEGEGLSSLADNDEPSGEQVSPRPDQPASET